MDNKNYEILSVSISSASSCKENRLAKKILGKICALNNTTFDGELLLEECTGLSGDDQQNGKWIEIDEGSVIESRHKDEVEIEDEENGQRLMGEENTLGHIELLESTNTIKSGEEVPDIIEGIECPSQPSPKRTKLASSLASSAGETLTPMNVDDEHSQRKSPIKNYALPRPLSTGELPPPQPTKHPNLVPKPKRKFGQLSAELMRRIRVQRSASTLAKFRAFVADGQQQKEGDGGATKMVEEKEYPDTNLVASAWGVWMVESRQDPERVLLKNGKI